MRPMFMRLIEFLREYGCTAVRLWWEGDYEKPPPNRPQPKERPEDDDQDDYQKPPAD